MKNFQLSNEARSFTIRSEKQKWLEYTINFFYEKHRIVGVIMTGMENFARVTNTTFESYSSKNRSIPLYDGFWIDFPVTGLIAVRNEEGEIFSFRI